MEQNELIVNDATDVAAEVVKPRCGRGGKILLVGGLIALGIFAAKKIKRRRAKKAANEGKASKACDCSEEVVCDKD